MPTHHLRPTPHIWAPGMRVLVGATPHRVISTHVGCFLADGDYHEVLLAPETDGESVRWLSTDYVTLDLDDPTTRRLLECLTQNDPSHGGDAASSGSSKSGFKSSSSSSSTSSSPSSESNSLDLEAIRERLEGSMSGHVSDMGWKLLAHAERDILDLIAEVRRLRGRR